MDITGGNDDKTTLAAFIEGNSWGLPASHSGDLACVLTGAEAKEISVTVVVNVPSGPRLKISYIYERQ